MDESINLLEKEKFIIITGDGGSGKTTFCHLLMARMKNILHNIPVIILTECSDLKKLDFTNGCIILIKDIVGKSDVDKAKFNRWSAYFDFMNNLILNSNVFIIFSLRNGVFHSMKDEFLDYAMFKRNTPIVDISGEKFEMSVQEKVNMLKMHCKNFKRCLSEESIKMIAEMNTPPGFAALCEKFVSNEANVKHGLSFFKGTFACKNYIKKVNDLLVTDQNLSYAVLISLFLEYNSYKKNTQFTFTNIVEGVDIRLVKPKEVKPAKIKNCLEGQLQAFIDSSGHNYKFKHLVMYVAVLISYSENYPEHFLKHVSRKVVYDYVRTNNYVAENHEVIVRFPCGILASKLVEICKPTIIKPYPDTHKHPSFQDKDLVRCFLNMVKSEKESNTFFNSLMIGGLKNEINLLQNNRYTTFEFDNVLKGSNSVIFPEPFGIFEESNNNNDLNKLFITKFLDPFVAGSCNEKNDFLASETINQFHNIYKFSFEVFESVLQYDLIDTYVQFLKNNSFKQKFLKNLYNEKSNDNYFIKAFNYGARKCNNYMLKYFDEIEEINAGKNLSEISKSLLEKHFLCENASHSLCFGNNWNDALIIKVITNTSWSTKQSAVRFMKKK